MSKLYWRRSTRSGGNGNCVEAAGQHGSVMVRDSKTVAGDDYPVLDIPAVDWAGLIASVRNVN